MRPRQSVWPWEGLYLYCKGMVGMNWREIVCVGPRHMVKNRGAEVAEWIWDRSRGLGLNSALRKQDSCSPVENTALDSCDLSGSWWVVSMCYLDTSHSLVYITQKPFICSLKNCTKHKGCSLYWYTCHSCSAIMPIIRLCSNFPKDGSIPLVLHSRNVRWYVLIIMLRTVRDW